MELSECLSDRLPTLTRMNRELYEDEKNDCIPPDDVLEQRLKNYLDQGAKAFLFEKDGETAGYALINLNATPNYLLHFYICREHRRSHLGTQAFHLLLKELNTDRMDLDVLCWNERGMAFWKSLGFRERCIIMRKES